MRRSPLAEELDQSADEGTRDALAVATRRRPRVRATSLPDALVEVPAIDAHAAGRERALADMAFTHGWMLFEEGMR